MLTRVRLPHEPARRVTLALTRSSEKIAAADMRPNPSWQCIPRPLAAVSRAARGGMNHIRAANCGNRVLQLRPALLDPGEGWRSYLDDEGEAVPFCPDCAHREFGDDHGECD